MAFCVCSCQSSSFSIENILPVYMRRPSGSVPVEYVSGFDINVTFRALDSDVRLHLPPDALDLPSGSHVNLTVSSVNLSATLLGVPQLIGDIGETGFEKSSRVNLDPYAIIHVAADVPDANSTSARLLKPVYLYVPVVLTDLPFAQLSTWLYNEDRGTWKRTNATVLEGQMLVLEISRFGWWSVAVNWTDTSCTSVSVSRSSSASKWSFPLSGSVVWLMGTDYPYSSVRGTDAAGMVCLEQKNHRSSIVRVENEQFGISSGPVFIGTSNGGACAKKERWLHATGTEGSCSSFEILSMNHCHQSCFFHGVDILCLLLI